MSVWFVFSRWSYWGTGDSKRMVTPIVLSINENKSTRLARRYTFWRRHHWLSNYFSVAWMFCLWAEAISRCHKYETAFSRQVNHATVWADYVRDTRMADKPARNPVNEAWAKNRTAQWDKNHSSQFWVKVKVVWFFMACSEANDGGPRNGAKRSGIELHGLDAVTERVLTWTDPYVSVDHVN